MAKLHLEQLFKTRLNSGLKEEITHLSLWKYEGSTSHALFKYSEFSNNLCGLGEVLALNYESGSPFKIKNNLINTPLLAFTIKKNEKPVEARLMTKSGNDYYLDITLKLDVPKADYDDVIVIPELELDFEGA